MLSIEVGSFRCDGTFFSIDSLNEDGMFFFIGSLVFHETLVHFGSLFITSNLSCYGTLRFYGTLARMARYLASMLSRLSARSDTSIPLTVLGSLIVVGFLIPFGSLPWVDYSLTTARSAYPVLSSGSARFASTILSPAVARSLSFFFLLLLAASLLFRLRHLIHSEKSMDILPHWVHRPDARLCLTHNL